MKRPIAITMDEDLISQVQLQAREDNSNVSSFINEIVKRAMTSKKDIFQKIRESNMDVQEYIRRHEENLKILEKMKIEGRLEERQAAEQFLAEENKKEQERLDKLKHYLDVIRKSQYYPELIDLNLKETDIEILSNYITLIQEEGLKIGIWQLRELIKEGLLNGQN